MTNCFLLGISENSSQVWLKKLSRWSVTCLKGCFLNLGSLLVCLPLPLCPYTTHLCGVMCTSLCEGLQHRSHRVFSLFANTPLLINKNLHPGYFFIHRFFFFEEHLCFSNRGFAKFLLLIPHSPENGFSLLLPVSHI